MSAYADLAHAYARTVGDRCQERQCWGWRCDQLVLSDWKYMALLEGLLEVLLVWQMQTFIVP